MWQILPLDKYLLYKPKGVLTDENDHCSALE